jgi:predicted nucleic acid-binding Zn ribbon protein
LKGTGWYATDYKDNGKKHNAAKPTKKPAEQKEIKTDTKNEKTSAT